MKQLAAFYSGLYNCALKMSTGLFDLVLEFSVCYWVKKNLPKIYLSTQGIKHEYRYIGSVCKNIWWI